MIDTLFARRSHTDPEVARRGRADELVAAARELRPMLREKQGAHEEQGGYDEQTHQALSAAGLYRVLQPEKFGGLELGFDAFLRVCIEISRGDPGVGWDFTLASGHAFHIGSFYGARAQEEIFAGTDTLAPGRTIPMGRAVSVEGGYRLDGTWDYCSGSTWATHVLVVAPTFEESGTPLGLRMFALTRDQFEPLGDWGGDQVLGMRASGSNSVRITDQFVRQHWSIPYDFREHELGTTGPLGFDVHPDPVYVGRTMAFFNAELVATQVGAAWAAIDEYEEQLRTKSASFPPRQPRLDAAEYHRWFGQMLALADSAETLLLGAMRQYTELAQRWIETGEEFTPEEDARLRAIIQQAAQLAGQVVEIAFTTAGTSSARRGSRLQKYFRDVAMYRTHIAAQWDVTYASASRYHFGQPLTF